MRGNYEKIKGFRVHNEEWIGFPIRYIETVNGDWFIVLKDLCDAINMRIDNATRVADPDEVVTVENMRPLKLSSHISRARHTQTMLAVSEYAAVEVIYSSRSVTAKEFKRWNVNVLKRLKQQANCHFLDLPAHVNHEDVYEESEEEYQHRMEMGLSRADYEDYKRWMKDKN